MNVIFIANKIDMSGGGSNFSLDLLARSLVDRGHNIDVITFNITSKNNLLDDHPYNVIKRPLEKKELLFPSHFSKVFTEFEEKADIYHIFSPLIAPYAGYYRKNGGNVPVFCRLNQYRPLCSDVSKMDGECHNQCGMKELFLHSVESVPNRLLRMPFYFLQSRKYTQWMDSVDTHYAISPAVKDVFEGFGVDGETIEVIPNFYDPDFVTDHVFSSNDTYSELLYVGRLSPEKGVDTLIQALQGVSSDVSLRIVGDGPHRIELEDLVVDLGLDDRVTFCGHVDHKNLSEYYHSADIFVHPGRWPEPFGRTILEAWQTECIVISSNAGGPPWVIGDAGLLFERNDTVGLAKQINRCVNDGELREKLLQKSANRLEMFSPETVLDTIESQMRELTSNQTM